MPTQSFKCAVTLERVAPPCQHETCMWRSTAVSGCMLHPQEVDPNELSDNELAEVKGISVKELQQLRSTGIARITSALLVVRYLDWCQKHAAGLTVISDEQAVNTWCSTHWLFSLGVMNWKPRTVGLCLNRHLVDRFLKTLDNQVNWLETLMLTKDEANAAVRFFTYKEIQ